MVVMRYFTTRGDVYLNERKSRPRKHHDTEMCLIKAYPEIVYQTVIGFGGAFTESAGYVYSTMPTETKERFLELCFGRAGNRYTLGRTPIQSSDFALGNYAYVTDRKDRDLTTFSVERDEDYIIPLICAAHDTIHQAGHGRRLELLASPWSPPAFMKNNHNMNLGGHLRHEYEDRWAQVIVHYLLAYRELGMDISRVTVQNEPEATQTWDSCRYSAKEEAAFASEHLRPALDAAGLSEVRIGIWDHNKDRILERCMETLESESAASSIGFIAFHWYSGDHFEELSEVASRYPDHELIFTEGCESYATPGGDEQTSHAEHYAHDLIGDFKAGMQGFLDWNLLLDNDGGPNHVGNYCSAPLMYDKDSDALTVNSSFYYIGHFSRFVEPGARRVLISSYTSALECVGFVNPDGTLVVVVLNRTDDDRSAFLSLPDMDSVELDLPAHSILTALW